MIRKKAEKAKKAGHDEKRVENQSSKHNTIFSDEKELNGRKTEKNMKRYSLNIVNKKKNQMKEYKLKTNVQAKKTNVQEKKLISIKQEKRV